MSKHTEKPWFVDETADRNHMADCLKEGTSAWIAVEDTSPNGGHVAYCHPNNAALIAAAPDLLEALKEITLEKGMTDKARAAIARAEE